MQGLLLRFLETGEIQKVGAERVAQATNVRVIAATNRNLRDLIVAGPVPRGPLLPHQRHPHRRPAAARAARGHSAARRPLPATRFTDRGRRQRQRQRERQRNATAPCSAIAPEAMAALCEYAWPGNVRQVENVIERLVVTGRREVVQLDDLSPEIRVARSVGHAAAAHGAAAHGRRRSVQEARRGARVVLDGGLSALHEPRDHAEQRARPGAQGTRTRRAATTRSCCGCSTWSRATTSGS